VKGREWSISNGGYTSYNNQRTQLNPLAAKIKKKKNQNQNTKQVLPNLFSR